MEKIIVSVLALLALALIVSRMLKKGASSGSGCGCGCGCATKPKKKESGEDS